MKKIWLTFVVLVFLSITCATVTYAQSLPDHPNCHPNANNCWGKIYTTHVGERTFQEISFLLKPVRHLSETIEIEVNGLVYHPSWNQGSYTIEADTIQSAFFKILDVNSHIVYAAEWSFISEDVATCATLAQDDSNYLIITAGHDVTTDNEMHHITTQTIVLPLDTTQYLIRQTVSGQVVRCKSLSKSPYNLSYEMKFNLFLPLITK